MDQKDLRAGSLCWINTKGEWLTLINGSDIEVIFASSDSDLQGSDARLFLYEFVGAKSLPVVGQPKVFEFRMCVNTAVLPISNREHVALFKTVWLLEEHLRFVELAQRAKMDQQYRLLTDLAAFDDNLSASVRFTLPAGSVVTCLWDCACDRGNLMFEDIEGKAVMFPAVRSFAPDGPVYLNPWLLEAVEQKLARCSA